MNFLLTVCVGFLTYYHQVHHCCAVEFDLDVFMKNFEKSQSELKWIRDESHKNEGKEFEWPDSKDKRFDDDDESSVDHWYNKYRKSECSTGQANRESKISNGYCGVYDDSRNEYPSKQDRVEESNHPSVSNFNVEPKDTKYDFKDSDSLTSNFDNFHGDVEQEHFDLDNDEKLSPEDKLGIEEYNEQMIPNPNFYKINNEMHMNDVQIDKAHDTFRNELGFSPVLSKYPSRDSYTRMENDYGNENGNNVQPQEIKMKRNTRDFDALAKPNSNQLSYGHLSDQQDTSKNDLSHEADYKLSKNEQDSHNKAEPKTRQWSQMPNEPQMQQKSNDEFDDKFENEFRNENKPQNVAPNNLQNTHASATVSRYNNFQDLNGINKPIADSNTNSHATKTGSKTNFLSKKQSPGGSKSQQQYRSKHDKSNQLTNEINLKISNRMMSKGLGPSLPSQSAKYYSSMYRHPMNVDVENQHWKDGRNENSNDLNDFVGLQRRLLQFDYEEPSNDYSVHESHNVPNEKNSLKLGSVKLLDNKLLHPENGEISKTPNTNSSENRSPKQLKTISDNSTIKKLDDVTIAPKLGANTNQSASNDTLLGHDDSIKIRLDSNVSNATTTEDKSAEDHGKIVKRSATYDKPFGLKETRIQDISKNSSIRDLVSGKLPNQLIQAVFQLVQENSRLNKVIGSKLDMKVLDNLELNSINLFKSKQKTDKMVKKLMSSITDLIEEQITHQTCISLPSDLQSFYDKVIYVRSINARVNSMRKQNKGSADANKNSTKRFARSAVSESDLHQKYKTVGKLLQQFGHLKLKDQMKVFDIKQFLQNHIQLLDDLKTLNSEFVRESRSVESKTNVHNNQDIKLSASEKGAGHISRQFANLLKTTKLIKTTSLTDMDKMDVIGTY